MRPFGLNLFAILVVTLLGFLLGGIWYGPLFGQLWLQALGKDLNQLLPPAVPMLISLFTQAALATALALLIQRLDLRGIWKGFGLGLLISVGIITMSMASDFAFANWGLRLFLLEAGFRVLYTALSCAILAGWR